MSDIYEESPSASDEQLELAELLKLARAQNRVLIQQNTLLRQQVTTLNDSLEDSNSKIEQLENDLDEATTHVKVLQNNILNGLDIHRELSDENENLKAKLAKEVNTSTSVIDEMEGMKSKLSMMESSLKESLDKQDSQRYMWDIERSELRSEIERLSNFNRSMQTERVSIESRMCGLQAESLEQTATIENLKLTQETLEERVHELENVITQKEENIQRYQGRVAAAEAMANQCQDEKARSETNEQQIRQTLQKLERHFKEREEELEKRSSELRTVTTGQLQADRERLSSALLSSEEELSRMKAENDALRKSKDRLELDVSKLKEQVNTLSAKYSVKDAEISQSNNQLSLRNQELDLMVGSLREEIEHLRREGLQELAEMKLHLSKERGIVENLQNDLSLTKIDFVKAESERKSFEDSLRRLEVTFNQEKTSLTQDLQSTSLRLREEIRILEKKYMTIKLRSRKQEAEAVELLVAQQTLRRKVEVEAQEMKRVCEENIAQLKNQVAQYQKKLNQVANGILIGATRA